MIKFERLTKAQYEECFSSMNREMNLGVFEELNYILVGNKGSEEDTNQGRVVHPTMECHREWFEDKVLLMGSLVLKLVQKLEPTTLSTTDKLELQKIITAISEAHNMIKLVWAAEQLLIAIKSSDS